MNKTSPDHPTTLSSAAGVFLALDIGGTKIAGGIINAEGRLLQSATVPTEAQSVYSCVRVLSVLAVCFWLWPLGNS